MLCLPFQTFVLPNEDSTLKMDFDASYNQVRFPLMSDFTFVVSTVVMRSSTL